MNKLIKVAIVGTGHIAEKFHFPAWQKNNSGAPKAHGIKMVCF